MIQTIAFYLFAVLVIASAVMVIMSRNPVHSVLWLILAFFNAAGLMVLVGAEFIAMLLVIVYVGAVAVLFLFEATGLVLLVAMIGAIVLTHRKTAGDHRGQQDIAKQNRRNPNEATVMKRPTVGEGVEL